MSDRCGGTLIADAKPAGRFPQDERDFTYYGGYLIAESIGSQADGAALAAVPQLEAAVRDLLDHCLLNRDQSTHDQRARVIRRAMTVLDALQDPPQPLLPSSPMADEIHTRYPNVAAIVLR